MDGIAPHKTQCHRLTRLNVKSRSFTVTVASLAAFTHFAKTADAHDSTAGSQDAIRPLQGFGPPRRRPTLGHPRTVYASHIPALSSPRPPYLGEIPPSAIPSVKSFLRKGSNSPAKTKPGTKTHTHTFKHTKTHTHIYIYIYMQIYIYIYANIYIYIYIYIYTHIHTHTCRSGAMPVVVYLLKFIILVFFLFLAID